MRRLGAIETTFRCPFILAQRALCAAAILARAAALIVQRPRVAPVLFNPLSALIAVSSAFTCWAALSRSAFNCASMSMCSSPGEDCSRYKQKLCGSLHQREQALVKRRQAPCVPPQREYAFLYSVLMNCLTCGLDTFRKFIEIEFEKSGVVQILPRGIGHSGLPAGMQGSAGKFRGYCAVGSSHSSTRSNSMLSVFWTEKKKGAAEWPRLS